jgi:hypothetical protein
MDDLNFNRIIDFLNQIGIKVSFNEIPENTFLPGLKISEGSLIIDTTKLIYPGDTLHEAGHIAVIGKNKRSILNDNMLDNSSVSAGNEMAAIAWSYAACKYLKIDPAYVFHENGYKGGSASILENFNNGYYFGVPLLQYYGMTNSPNLTKNSVDQTYIYPEMIFWLSQKD